MPYLPTPPPARGTSRGLVTGLVVGGVALIVVAVLIVTSVTLLGRKASDTDVGSADPPARTAPTARATGPCGPIPFITAQPGAVDPDLLIKPTYVEGLDLSVFEQFYGPLTLTDSDELPTVDAYMELVRTTDNEARRAELVADGFRGGFDRKWLSSHDDSVSVRVAAFEDSPRAQAYANFHLQQACADEIWDLAPTANVDGAVTYMALDANGRPEVRMIGVVGNAEINVTVCTCRPASTGRSASEAWVKRLQRDLVDPPA
jgi:hypothetical protein